MRILGIDPGPVSTAVVCWDGLSVTYSSELPSAAVLESIRGCGGMDYAIACEHLQCFGMAVGKETFETAYWIGAYRHAAEIYKIPFHRVYRSEEKMTLCHSMRATDSNIRQAIIDRFGGKDAAIGKKKTPGPLYGISGDMWSALAVALTFEQRAGITSGQTVAI